ncbi:MAG: deoxyguanosinetriphosphate triphosphohydrolase, partial [Alphaproteobacteria bacterium]
TQVFVYHEGDHYRTRLTHSLEVSQIARSIARVLRLDEDLAECLALAHDLGHPPFGHAGERVLDEVMAPHGGFDHNAQTIRIVTRLEARYAAFAGLNLTWETLEGLAKHNGPLVAHPIDPAAPPGSLPFALSEYLREQDLELHTWPSAEAQAAAIADDVAYNNHDIDDGLRAGLFSLAEIATVPLVGRVLHALDGDHPDLPLSVRVHELVRRLIATMIEDILAESRRRLDALAAADIDAIRAAPHAVIAFSEPMRADIDALRDFLRRNMYRHRLVKRTTAKAKRVVRELFALYMGDPGLMPAEWAARAGSPGSSETARAVADFIAGMTDRYAIREYRKLFDVTAFPT